MLSENIGFDHTEEEQCKGSKWEGVYLKRHQAYDNGKNAKFINQ